MSEAPSSWAAVLARLRERGLVDEAGERAVSARLDAEAARPPWTVVALAGAGAWAAATCFVVFLGAAKLFGTSGTLWTGWGVALCVVALLIARLARGVFLRQLALALSLTGQTLVVVGVGDLAKSFGASVLASVGLCVVLYPLQRDPAHRFITTLLAALMATVYGALEPAHRPVLDLVVAGEVVGLALTLAMRRSPAALAAAGHALAVALCATLVTPIVVHEARGDAFVAWPSTIILALGVAALAARLAAGAGRVSRPMAIAGLACIAALAALSLTSSPVVLAALGLLLLGRSRESIGLQVIGAAFLPIALACSFVALDLPLSRQALVVGGSGLVLLVALWVLQRAERRMAGAGA
jgi:hypothetical protein